MILGAALDHRRDLKRLPLLTSARLPTCARRSAARFRGDYFLRKCTRELKGAQVKSQPDKDEKRDTQSY